MSAVKEAFLNNIRYADKSASVDLYEFPDEPLTDEQKQEMAEEHDVVAENFDSFKAEFIATKIRNLK